MCYVVVFSFTQLLLGGGGFITAVTYVIYSVYNLQTL